MKHIKNQKNIPLVAVNIVTGILTIIISILCFSVYVYTELNTGGLWDIYKNNK